MGDKLPAMRVWTRLKGNFWRNKDSYAQTNRKLDKKEKSASIKINGKDYFKQYAVSRF